MNISNCEKAKLNKLLKGEKGVHWKEAFNHHVPPYKTTELEWYKKKQEEE